ncbi:cysteine protease StiP family protein [Proteus mirabilis]|uniref:cysteine protease StiP family protein n=1 Tax=Proteus mirabilis TaxID=584 RepID=UPI0034E53573
MMDHQPFSGSYVLGDVDFLLQPVKIEMTPVELKEELIQSGKRHYSDMLSQEPEPTPWHLDLFEKALNTGAERLAREVIMLAKSLITHFGETPIILTSLVRAGVPLGVMLQQTLRKMGKTSYHYGISIIRDRGIDSEALLWIEQRHGTEGIVFVDGWTGKGAITGELIRSLAGREGFPAQPHLVVLADPCGCAWLSASDEDWLIPFGIMGAPVSGLISRSIWTEQGFHGFVDCQHLKQYECSRYLVDTAGKIVDSLIDNDIPLATFKHPPSDLKKLSENVVSLLANKYDISNINRIKPGIAEATRAVLRRVPEHILVKEIADPDVALLIYLAKQKNITVTEAGKTLGQYRAVTIIKKVQ